MKKQLLFLSIFISLFAVSQPTIQWQKCLGGSANDYAQSVQQTFDGGYIVAGYTFSNDSMVSGNKGNDDYWVVKLNSLGGIQWKTCLGGSNYDEAYSVQQTSDSGYVVAGFASSNNGDITSNQGSDDFWIIKLNSSGAVQWQKTYGGLNADDALTIKQTSDGGFVIIGDTQSNSGDVTGNHGNYDCWILKTDASGTLLWKKCLGGTGDDSGSSVQQTLDGGFVVVGSTTSNNGDVSGNHGDWDVWVVKLNDTAAVEWQKCLGGTLQDIGYSIYQSADSGYVVAGFTKSNNGDVSGIHGTVSPFPDMWVLKLSKSGALKWQKCLGGTDDDKAYSVKPTNDGGSIVAGYTKSDNGDVSGNHYVGNHDYWLVKLDSAGATSWQKCLGGTGLDWARSVQQTVDNGYIVAGFTSSGNNGDVSGKKGNSDFWVVKLSAVVAGIKKHEAISEFNVYPNPANGVFYLTAQNTIPQSWLKVTNLLGETIYSTEITGTKNIIDLSAQPKGIYFLSIENLNYKWTNKIIIE